MKFRFILECIETERMTFVTVDECIDLEDSINHIRKQFPLHTHRIEQIREVRNDEV